MSTTKEAIVARQLREAGFKVLRVTPADDQVDATVEITEHTHVTISTFDRTLCVVRECANTDFIFFPLRQSCDGLLDDLRKALADEAAEAGAMAERKAKDAVKLDVPPLTFDILPHVHPRQFEALFALGRKKWPGIKLEYVGSTKAGDLYLQKRGNPKPFIITAEEFAAAQ